MNALRHAALAWPVLLLAGACVGGEPTSPSRPAAAPGFDAANRANPAEIVTWTTLDVPNALSTAVTDINSAGAMVGRFTDATGKDHGFLLREGAFTTIDFPGPVLLTAAAGINARGDIVGNYHLSTEPSAVRHGFLLRDGAFTTIDYPGAAFTNALGINPQGDIVGRYMNTGGMFHGYRFSDGAFTPIDVPGATSTHAWRSDAAGQVVGDYQGPDGAFHVFQQSGGRFTSFDFSGALQTAPFPLVPLGGIGASGQIVSTGCDRTPCTLGSSGNVHAYVLSRGVWTVLDFPGAILTGANGINNQGAIVGIYIDAAHRNHGFRRDAR